MSSAPRMNCLITNQELMITGVLAVVLILLSVWMSFGVSKRTDLPAGFKQPGMALQLSGTKEGVTKIIGPENSQHRKELRANISKDFVYIFSYTSFMVALSLVLSQANSPLAKWLGSLAAILVVGAAAFDFVENYCLLQVLSTPSENITDAASSSIRMASLVKWLLFFLAIGVRSIILLQLLNVYALLGVAMLAASIVGIIGLRSHQLLTPAMGVFAVCVIAFALVFLLIPDRFLRAIC